MSTFHSVWEDAEIDVMWLNAWIFKHTWGFHQGRLIFGVEWWEAYVSRTELHSCIPDWLPGVTLMQITFEWHTVTTSWDCKSALSEATVCTSHWSSFSHWCWEQTSSVSCGLPFWQQSATLFKVLKEQQQSHDQPDMTRPVFYPNKHLTCFFLN